MIIGCYHKDGNLYFYNDKSGAICGNNEYNVVKDGSTGKIAYIQKGVLRNCIDFRYSDGYAVGTSEENAVVSNVCSSTRLYGVNPAYHLNGFISGDFTNWRQNIDNGLPKDDYPVLDSEHGIVYRISSGSYSNTPSSETLPEDLIASGNSGPNIEWSLDKNGVLTLKGYGDMPDYSYGEPGWFPYHELIHQVTFEGSITSVGSHAFHDYVNLEYVALPDQ